MEILLSKLTNLINELHEHPNADSNYLLMQCLLELWESNELIVIPTYKDLEGKIYLDTIKPNSEENENIPLLQTEINTNGQEVFRVINDEEFIVFFTDERVFIKQKGTTVMYGSFDTLIQVYTENKDHCLGIIVNPFQEKFTLYLTSRTLDILIKLRNNHRTDNIT